MDHAIVQSIVLWALPLIFAVSFHEAAHGFMANRLGDPTARILGRLTLNPLRHIDLWGTIIIPLVLIISKAGVIFGYAKPVPVNPYYFKNPKRDMALVAFSGPGTNFFFGFLCGILFNIIVLLQPNYNPLLNPHPRVVEGIGGFFLVPILLILLKCIQLNVILGVFNLLPIPPLDGGRILLGFLPDSLAEKFGRLEPFGFFIVLFFIIFDPFGIISRWLWGIMDFIFQVFLFGVF